jgi:hypothetical protein
MILTPVQLALLMEGMNRRRTVALDEVPVPSLV